MNSEDLVLVENESSMRLVSPPSHPHTCASPPIQTNSAEAWSPHTHNITSCSSSMLNPAPACKRDSFPLPLGNNSDSSCYTRPRRGSYEPRCHCYDADQEDELPYRLDTSTSGTRLHNSLPVMKTENAMPWPKPLTRKQRDKLYPAYPDTTLSSLSPPAAPQTLVSIQPYAKVFSPTELIPARYASDSAPKTSHIIRIEPYSRTVLSVFNSAQPADFKECAWLLQYGETELWYSKPRQFEVKSIAESRRVNGDWVNGLLNPFEDPRPACLEFPKIWASAALTTPKDDDILDCELGHNFPINNAESNGGNTEREDDIKDRTCIICTDEKSEALKATPLTYYLVFTTTNISEKDYYNGPKPTGEKIFRLAKYGSRQAAVAEAFYAAGVNGWNLAFSCVVRDDEDMSKAGSVLGKVDELWQLAEGKLCMQERTVRVFY